MLKPPAPAWLKDVQTLTSPELDELQDDMRDGKLTEAEAKPLLVAAGLRAAGQALVREPEPVARR